VLVAEFYLPTYNPAIPGFHQPALNITDGSNNFVRLLGLNGGGSTSRMDMYSGGVSQATVDAGAVPPLFSRTKVAVGWSPSRVAISRDGTLGGASSGSFLLPVSPIALEFGRWSGHPNIIISRAWYYSGARPDAFVQGVSR
jgi:hypothetical protein